MSGPRRTPAEVAAEARETIAALDDRIRYHQAIADTAREWRAAAVRLLAEAEAQARGDETRALARGDMRRYSARQVIADAVARRDERIDEAGRGSRPEIRLVQGRDINS